MTKLQKQISKLKGEWADAGDDVPDYLQVINALLARSSEINHAAKTLPSVNAAFLIAMTDISHDVFGEEE